MSSPTPVKVTNPPVASKTPSTSTVPEVTVMEPSISQSPFTVKTSVATIIIPPG
jgi:hypothetical protein